MKKTTIFSLYIILFLTGVSAYADDYRTSNIYYKEEINYIEKLQKEGIRIGVNIESVYIDTKNPKESIAYKYGSLLEDFFHIDAELVKGSWIELYKKLKKEEIDLLLNFTLSEKRKDEFNLSIPIYEDKVYAVSTNRNISLDSWGDLVGKEIIVMDESAYREYLKEFKEKNNLNFKIKKINSSYKSSEYNYVISHTGDLDFQYLNALELGSIDPIGIGIAKNKVLLKKVIDKALVYSHKEQLLKMFKNEKIKLKKRAFYKNLNKSEKNYLENKKRIEVLVDSEFYPVFYYDKDKKTYDGIFSRELDELSLLLDKPIEIINQSPDESWNSIYDRFKKDEGDMTIMYFTPKRGRLHKFSLPMDYSDILLVSNKKKTADKKTISSMEIGVVIDDISESTALKSFSKTNKITRYKRYEDMIEALKDGDIDSCVIDNDLFMYYQQTRFDLSLNKLKILEKLPICFAVQDKNEILLSIINKAANGFIHHKDIKMDFLQEMATIKIAKEIEYNNRNKLILLMTTVMVTMAAIIVAGTKHIWNRKLHRLAYYDHLTGALNRISFEKDMNKINSSQDRGMGMYIDLNKFKMINDNYGHHAGDIVLKEVVTRLQKTFKMGKVYRLAGDEFFIFLKGLSLEMGITLAEKAMEELKKPINTVNTAFEISVSIGICELDEKIENQEEFLHRADIAMYTAKKKNDGTIVVATAELIDRFDKDKN